MANRLRNIRPSPETSREVLLKGYKQYFVTPITAQSLGSLPTSKGDSTPNSSLRRSRLRCYSAHPSPRGSQPPRRGAPARPLTGVAPAPTPVGATPTEPHASTSRQSLVETPHTREVLDGLNSVRRALYEQRVKGKL